MIDLDGIRESAETLARAAGTLALERWDEPLGTRLKGARDVLTDIDLASQALIVEGVQARYPEHGIIGEEDGLHDGDLSGVKWLIDPIDGTSNYSRKVSIWCVSIGVAVDGVVQVGVVYDAVRDEMYTAVRGKGACVNGRPLQVTENDTLDKTVFVFDWGRPPELRVKNHKMIGVLMEHVRTPRSLGSAALTMCWMAAGRIDAYFNLMLGAWDVAAATLILHEAGGKTTGLDDAPFDIARKKTWYVSSNGLVHDELLRLINLALEE